jgi:hypothetical protein
MPRHSDRSGWTELGHALVVAVLELGEQADRTEHAHHDHEDRGGSEHAVAEEPEAEEQRHDHGDLDAEAERILRVDASLRGEELH